MKRNVPVVAAATISKLQDHWSVVVNFTDGTKKRSVFEHQIDAEMFYMSMWSRMT